MQLLYSDGTKYFIITIDLLTSNHDSDFNDISISKDIETTCNFFQTRWTWNNWSLIMAILTFWTRTILRANYNKSITPGWERENLLYENKTYKEYKQRVQFSISSMNDGWRKAKSNRNAAYNNAFYKVVIIKKYFYSLLFGGLMLITEKYNISWWKNNSKLS